MDIHKQSIENIEAFFRESKNQVSSWMAMKKLIIEGLDPLRKANSGLHTQLRCDAEQIKRLKFTIEGSNRVIDQQQDEIHDLTFALDQAQRKLNKLVDKEKANM